MKKKNIKQLDHGYIEFWNQNMKICFSEVIFKYLGNRWKIWSENTYKTK